MENNTQLPSFKTLLKNSLTFYKANWKKLLLSLLPIELVIVLSTLVMDMTADSDSRGFAILGLIFALVSLLSFVAKKIIVLGHPHILRDIDEGNVHHSNKIWYKKIIKDIFPLIWVGVIVALLNLSFVLVLICLGVFAFILPTFIIAILVRTGFSDFGFYLYDIFINNTTILISGACIALLGFVASLAFFTYSSFSLYAYIIEGRKGLDAVVTSFLLVSGRWSKIFLRLMGIWAISAVPFFVLVLPVYAKIAYESIKAMVIEVAILHIPPALPTLPLSLTVTRDILVSVESLISLPIFFVLMYFLWKDVKATSGNFKEDQYLKVRAWIKRGGLAGVIIVLIVIISLVFVASTFKGVTTQ